MNAVQRHGMRVHLFCRARPLWLAVVFACGIPASGCAPPALYDWGLYEESLEANYVTHDEVRAWSDLEATITLTQQTGRRIPPGVCAEYGFFLYKRGQRERAIEYFEREAQLFPESRPLMDRLIAKVRERAAADGQPPAGGGSVQ
jgi:hypothetical protein